MSSERINVSHRDGVTILRPTSNEFDGEVANAILGMLYELLADGSGSAPKVVVDLSEVSFIDSLSLGTLVKAASDIGKRGGKFFVAAAQQSVLRTLALTRMDKLFNMFPSVDAAIKDLITS